jgi:molybdopterin converting factor small subunit
MSDLAVTVRLFGAFRDLHGEGDLRLSVPSGTTVAELRGRIAVEMERRRPGTEVARLLELSVLGDERAVLSDETKLERPSSLALLPPVCGG